MRPSVGNGEKNDKKSWKDWIKAGLVVFLALAFFRMIQSSGWAGGVSPGNENITLGVSFLVGLAASFSTCLAVVGGIVIAFSEKYRGGERNFSGAVWPNAKFHAGRVFAFFAFGGVLGFAGGEINIGGNFISLYTIIIAVVMGWLGLNMLGSAPSLSSLGMKTPKFLVRYWGKLEDSRHHAAPYILGGITFFLPCGFTQSMQIISLASGSFWTGASIMSAFALGTMPVLLALGAAASWAKAEKMNFAGKAAGIIVILFAVYTFNSGYALLGTKNGGPAPADSRALSDGNERTDTGAESANPAVERGVQKTEMKITPRGFEPSVLRVKNNIPVRFAINGDQATGCTNEIVIPDLGVEKEIKKGENIIEFTPKKVGSIAYSCWMGMVRGKIIVE